MRHIITVKEPVEIDLNVVYMLLQIPRDLVIMIRRRDVT
jgi:hypothetical protein